MTTTYTLVEHSNHVYPSLSDTDPAWWWTYYDEYPLFEEGCWVKDVRDCGTMCADPNLIWAGLNGKFNPNVSANVANCIVYTVLQKLWADEPDIKLRNPELAERYGIRKETNSVLLESPPVDECLNNFCQSNPQSCANGTNPFDGTSLVVPFNSGNITVPTYNGLCVNMQTDVNPDIAGIGVLIAYLMAALLLILMYIALRASRNVIRLLAVSWFFFIGLWHSETRHQSRKRASVLQKRVAESRHIATLITSLADFQKAQCVFWLAIDAAVLMGIWGSADILGAEDYASFVVNVTALSAISVCGFLFTTFGLYCLHLVPQRSWYVFSLSFLTATLSAIAWGSTFFSNPSEIKPKDAPPALQSCGPFDPQTYCRGYFNTVEEYTQLLSYLQLDSVAIGVGGVSMIVLLGDMIIHNTKCRTSQLAQRLCACGPDTSRWRSRLISTVRFFAELLFLFLWTVLFAYLIVVTKNSDTSSWGFGQIIALTIWIPILMEWSYATHKSIEIVAEHRLPPGYMVTRKKSNSETRGEVAYTELHTSGKKEYSWVSKDPEDFDPSQVNSAKRISQISIRPTKSEEDVTSAPDLEHRKSLLRE